MHIGVLRSLAFLLEGVSGEGAKFSDEFRRRRQAALRHAAGKRNFSTPRSIKVTVEGIFHIVAERRGERGRNI